MFNSDYIEEWLRIISDMLLIFHPLAHNNVRNVRYGRKCLFLELSW